MLSFFISITMKQIDASTFLVDNPIWPNFLNNRPEDSTKSNYGHALLIAGSYGKMGAAILAAKACLRSGVGLITVHVPQRGVDIMQTAVPEAMVSIDENDTHWTHAFTEDELRKYDAIALGPGLGTQSTDALVSIFHVTDKKPLIVDADGLNMLARYPNKENLMIQHTQSAPLILTPHAKEFERLFGTFPTLEARDEAQREKSRQLNTIIVHKGHETRTTSPNGYIYLNTTGNAGMATAGSGDVLTGIILAILSQNKEYQHDATSCTTLSVWIHGKSGDYSIKNQSKCSLIASDIVKNLQYVTNS